MAFPTPPALLAHQLNAPELEKPVTYSETKIPLGELLARVAADTGVALTAASDVADEPVAVVATDVPARELMDQLAELLDYFELEAPGQLERRADELSLRLERAVRAA